MATIKIASPLYIVREEAQKDFFGVLEKLAAIGYDGVELLGLYGHEPSAIRAKLDALGIVAMGAHVNITELEEQPEKTIETYKTLGCQYITFAMGSVTATPGTPEFAEVAARLQTLCCLCYDNGFTPLYHNHANEFATSPDLLSAYMDACAAERLCQEPDLGWMLYAGADPADYLIKYKDRTPVIHLKDIYAEDFSKIGPLVDQKGIKHNPETGFFEFRPTGYGLLNLPKLMPMCLACNPAWFVPDHDLAYERDSFEDLRLSYEYVKDLLNMMC